MASYHSFPWFVLVVPVSAVRSSNFKDKRKYITLCVITTRHGEFWRRESDGHDLRNEDGSSSKYLSSRESELVTIWELVVFGTILTVDSSARPHVCTITLTVTSRIQKYRNAITQTDMYHQGLGKRMDARCWWLKVRKPTIMRISQEK